MYASDITHDWFIFCYKTKTLRSLLPLKKKNGKITLKINSLKRKSSLGKTVLDVIHFVCVAAQRNAISQMYFKTGADRHRETELNRPNIFMMLRKRTVRFIFIEVVDYSLSMQLVHLHSVSFCFFVVQYGVKPFKNTCATILSLFVIFFLHFARPFQSHSFTYSLESRFSLALENSHAKYSHEKNEEEERMKS